MAQVDRIKDNKQKALNLLLEEIQKDINEQAGFVENQNAQLKEAELSYNSLKDSLEVLKVAKEMIPQLQNQFGEEMGEENGAEGMSLLENKSINIQQCAGVIDQIEIGRLNKLIFRSTKGKSYVHVQEIEKNEDDEDDNQRRRSVYIVVFWDGEYITDKIKKICDSFLGQRFELPGLTNIDGKIREVKDQIKNAESVWKQTRETLIDQLEQFDKIQNDESSTSTIFIYKMFLAKEKALYQTLNLMKWQDSIFIGFFWAPKGDDD